MDSTKQFKTSLIQIRIIMIALYAFVAYFSQHGWQMAADGAPLHNMARGNITGTLITFTIVWIAGEFANYRFGRSAS